MPCLVIFTKRTCEFQHSIAAHALALRRWFSRATHRRAYGIRPTGCQPGFPMIPYTNIEFPW